MRGTFRGVRFFYAEFHKYFDILETHEQLFVTGWLWERCFPAFSLELVKHPLGVGGSVLLFRFTEYGCCSIYS